MFNFDTRLLTQFSNALVIGLVLSPLTLAQSQSPSALPSTELKAGLQSRHSELGVLATTGRVPFAPQALTQANTPGWLPTFGPGGGISGVPLTMQSFDDGNGEALFVAGLFQITGGIGYEGSTGLSNIGRWDGEAWTSLGGANSDILALTVFDDGSGSALYAGGAFSSIDGVSATGVAKWDGSNWAPVGSATLGFVTALTVFDDGNGAVLIAGGKFSGVGGVAANNVAKWDGVNWAALGTGVGNSTNANVRSLSVYDDGGGDALYVGGSFTTAGGGSVNNIAKWNGSNWSSLGSGIEGIGNSAIVRALEAFDDGGGAALYAGGLFTTAGGSAAGNIAKWDGSSWSALGLGVDSMPFDFTVYDDGSGDALFVGGTFGNADGLPASRIAKWDGASWSALGDGIGPQTTTAYSVYAVTTFDDGNGEELYLGGLFLSSGGLGARNIAAWNGSTWSSDFGARQTPNKLVNTMAVFDDGGGTELYAGGQFETAGGVDAERIASWDGNRWAPLGSGMDGTVRALSVFDDGGGAELYAGGFFTDAGGVSANRIAKWNGANWFALGSGMNDWVYALAEFDDGSGAALYAAGKFTIAGGGVSNRIARWDGVNWTPLGNGFDNEVYALTVFDDGAGDALYAGGKFTIAGGVQAASIAKWDGVSWTNLGAGFNFAVNALTVFDDGNGAALYAGGNFTVAGGVPAFHIAKWNGSSWAALGSGMGDRVNSLAVYDDGSGAALYAGGEYSVAGGTPANRIAKWDGSSWSALGVGTDKNVRALTVYDDGDGAALYAGGLFTTAGGLVTTHTAKWGCPALGSTGLSSDTTSISLSTGGQQLLALDGGANQAGWFYFVLGSVTGTTPGIDFGSFNLPLNFDVYFNLTLTKPGLGAFGNFRGVLDGTGQAQSSLTLPTLMDPALIGVTINHAYLGASVFGAAEFASNAVGVTLVP